MDRQLTPAALETALARLGDGAMPVDDLAERVREWFGADKLSSGPDPKVDELTVAWALETPGDGVRVLADDNSFSLLLRRLGRSRVFAGVATLLSGTAFRWNYEITDGPNERRTLLPDISSQTSTLPSGTVDDIRRIRGRGRPLEVYATHPDSRPNPGVPRGELVEHRGWRSTVFPNTSRDWWVYVPARYRAEEAASVMVFQDGRAPRDYVPPAFDNLIDRGDMPVTVGVFIMPGMLDDGTPNRSFEYDTLSDQYARFLLDEILPEVEKTVRLRQDARSRAIS